MAELAVTVCGIRFPNPIWTAAGPGGADGKLLVAAARGGAGGLVTKTLSVSPARVPVPNIATPFSGSLLNAELWSEIDYRAFLDTELPKAQATRLPVVVSLGYSPEELALLGHEVEKTGLASAVEFSIHYTDKDPITLAAQARALKHSTHLPVLAKLSPAVANLSAVVRILEPIVDGFVAINSLGPALDFDVSTRRPLLGSRDGRGWLSGRAILPVGLHYVEAIAGLTSKPVIGVGGVRSIVDVVKYLMAGAAAVQICTLAVLQGQEVYGKLAEGLSMWLDTHGFASVQEIRGLYRRERAAAAKAASGGAVGPSAAAQAAGAAGERLRDPGDPAANPYPAIEPELCDLCLACQRACIHRAIEFQDKTFFLNRTECVSCGLCCTVCPRDALSLE
jgi:dihydroorotate dehydrogenase subfamily 1